MEHIITPRKKAADAYQTVEKALSVLELLAASSPRGVGELAQAMQLEQSGVSRLLKMLAGLGYTTQTGQRGRYRLGPQVLYLGEQYAQGNPLLRESATVLSSLAQATRASAHLATWSGQSVRILAKTASPERIQVASSVGAACALHASALGKVLLATKDAAMRRGLLTKPLTRFTDRTITSVRALKQELATVRQRGYAIEEGEEDGGVGCIGAPVVNDAGACIAAISISGPLQGTPFRVDGKHAEILTDHAAQLSRRMGWQGTGQVVP